MSQKILLPNGCSMSTPTVNPKNWMTGSIALINKPWQISYYFHSDVGKIKQVSVRGMNGFKTLNERRSVTKRILEDLIENNKIGYNPISKKFIQNADQNSELNPKIQFIRAFRNALAVIQCSDKHRKEMNWCINRIEKKVVKLGLQHTEIGQLSRRQLKQLIESCDLPNNHFNKYRSYLSRIFSELIQYECCEINLVRDIRKRKILKKQREILSPEDHKLVMDFLRSNYYEFWRYAQIFLFSGARTTELFRVKVKDVKVANQEYNTTLLKGSTAQEVTKVIIEEVVPLWRELLKGAKPDEYLFSRGLVAGKDSIHPFQITKRWQRLVKQSDKIIDKNGKIVKITADFYSLKHSFLDSLPQETAMLIASHTNSKTTSLYRVNEAKRQREKLKKLKIEKKFFGG